MNTTFRINILRVSALILIAVSLLTVALCGCEYREEPSPAPPTEPVEYFTKTFGDPDLVEYNALDYLEAPAFSTLKLYKAEMDKMVSYDLASAVLNSAEYDTFSEAGSATVAWFDTANVNYKGRLKDESIEVSDDTMAGMDNTAQTSGYSLVIGSASFIGAYFGDKGVQNDGFEEQLIGMSVGETKEITVTFPDEYSNEELRSLEVIFTVTVNSLKRPKVESFIPTDEQTKKITDGIHETTAAYKEHLENYYKGVLSYDIVYKSINVKETCSAIVDIYVDMYIHEYVVYTKGEQITQAEYDAAYAELKQSMYSAAYDAAVAETKEYMITRYLFEYFEIVITDEEFNARVEEIYTENEAYYNYYGIDSVEAFVEYFSRNTLEISFKNEKLLEVIGDAVTIVE